MRKYVYDRELSWKLNPGYTGPILGCKKAHINAAGFRGTDYSQVPKGDDKIRLLVAGDSNTAGWALPDDSRIYCGILEKELNRKLGKNKNAEVVNLGVVAYSTHQGKILIKRCCDNYEPDYVVIMYGANDAVVFSQSDREKLEPVYLFTCILDHSAIYTGLKYVIRKINRKRILQKERERLHLQHETGRESLRVPTQHYYENIVEISRYIHSRGAKLVIITYPYVSLDLELAGIMKQFNQAIDKCKEETGCYVFDFFPLIDSLPVDSAFLDYPGDSIHMTYLGHKLLGENLAAYIYNSMSLN